MMHLSYAQFSEYLTQFKFFQCHEKDLISIFTSRYQEYVFKHPNTFHSVIFSIVEHFVFFLISYKTTENISVQNPYSLQFKLYHISRYYQVISYADENVHIIFTSIVEVKQIFKKSLMQNNISMTKTCNSP
jgi:hypothetical protein